MSREVLFAGDDVLAYGRAGDATTPLAITFGAMPPAGRPDLNGFGDKFLSDRRINAIHVVPLKKQWYQTPEMTALIPLLRARRAGFARCVVYGSSMGAYAALLFGARLDADTVVALSPQMSIAPDKAGFDRRWADIGRRLRFIDDDAVGASRAARDVHIFYDPFEPRDRRHALAFARPGIGFHRVPFAGHQVAGMLRATGGLADMATDLIMGRFVWRDVMRRLRQARPRSIVYWRGMFLAAIAIPRHARFATFALERLIATGAARPPLLCAMAREATQGNRCDLAVTALAEAVRQGGEAGLVRPLMARLGGRVPAADLAAVYAAFQGPKTPPLWTMAPLGAFLRLRDTIGPR